MKICCWYIKTIKKELYIFSNIHDIKTERVTKRGHDNLAPSKLEMVNNYNKYMGCLDHNGALIANYTSVCESFKWTVKVAFYFID